MSTMSRVLLSSLLLLLLVLPDVQAVPSILAVKHHHPKFQAGPWQSAHATFYGGSDASGTNGGSCGYENLQEKGYGIHTAALSISLYRDGLACGSCYEVKCVDEGKQYCNPGQPSVLVTGTNLCPDGGYCSVPKAHFDLSEPAFTQIAQRQAGVIPVQYRRVPCKREGGVRFTITGNPNYNLVLVWNVAGAGDIKSVKVKGSQKLAWTTLKRNWGQNWETDSMLQGESLTFRVRTSDGRTSTSWHVTPENWQFGQTFEGKNFK